MDIHNCVHYKDDKVLKYLYIILGMEKRNDKSLLKICFIIRNKIKFK